MIGAPELQRSWKRMVMGQASWPCDQDESGKLEVEEVLFRSLSILLIARPACGLACVPSGHQF